MYLTLLSTRKLTEKFEHNVYYICIHFDYVLGFTGNLCVLLCR